MQHEMNRNTPHPASDDTALHKQSKERLQAEVKKRASGLDNKNSQLMRLRNKLNDSERMKDMLMKTIVHDIKNHIFSIAGNIQSVSRSLEGDQKNKEKLKIVSRTCSDIFALASNIIEIEHLENGTLVPQKRLISSDHIIEIINNSIRKEAFREKNIQMTINPGTTPFFLHADPYLFERVVQNIIRNAAHAVRENGEAGIWFMTKENEHILCFFNSGIPIPAQYRESIFNKFSAGKKSYNKYSKGTGLYFCRLVMHAHQGRIWLDTTENGNTFYVSFPSEKL